MFIRYLLNSPLRFYLYIAMTFSLITFPISPADHKTPALQLSLPHTSSLFLLTNLPSLLSGNLKIDPKAFTHNPGAIAEFFTDLINEFIKNGISNFLQIFLSSLESENQEIKKVQETLQKSSKQITSLIQKYLKKDAEIFINILINLQKFSLKGIPHPTKEVIPFLGFSMIQDHIKQTMETLASRTSSSFIKIVDRYTRKDITKEFDLVSFRSACLKFAIQTITTFTFDYFVKQLSLGIARLYLANQKRSLFNSSSSLSSHKRETPSSKHFISNPQIVALAKKILKAAGVAATFKQLLTTLYTLFDLSKKASKPIQSNA